MSETLRLDSKHSGADWLKRNGVKNMSDFGERVADLIGQIFKGIYHCGDEALRVNWSMNGHIQFSCSLGFATWDFNELTELVVLAHDLAIRVEIRPYGPKNLQLIFHPRMRVGSFTERHPTLEEAAKIVREQYTITTTKPA